MESISSPDQFKSFADGTKSKWSRFYLGSTNSQLFGPRESISMSTLLGSQGDLAATTGTKPKAKRPAIKRLDSHHSSEDDSVPADDE